MCNLLKALVVITTAITVTGCAGWSNYSTAFQVNKIAAPETIWDEDSNEDHVEESRVAKHAANIGLSTYSAANPSSLSLSDFRFDTLGFSVLIALMDSQVTRSNEKTWVAGWKPVLPAQTADQAHDEIFNVYRKAVEQTLKEEGFGFDVHTTVDEKREEDDLETEDFKRYTVYALSHPDYGCEYQLETEKQEGYSNCAVVVDAGGIDRETAPEIVATAGQDVWAFGYLEGHEIRFIGEEVQLPTVDLHQKISEKLPKWAYMFQPDAANYVMISKDAQVKGYPYFLHQGHELHFVDPKED